MSHEKDLLGYGGEKVRLSWCGWVGCVRDTGIDAHDECRSMLQTPQWYENPVPRFPHASQLKNPRKLH